jgi:hypothetical protein
MCAVCGLDPCACGYIAKLQPGGDLEELSVAAALNVGQPHPHRDAVERGDHARSLTGLSCPCPECWSLRAASWTALKIIRQNATEETHR